MKYWYKICLIVLCALAGMALLFYRTDREFINLQPTPGAAFVVPLENGSTYEFTFTVNRSTVTRLGLWFKPLRENLPNELIKLTITRDAQVIAEQTIASAFIDGQGFTQVRFKPALQVAPGAKLRTSISVAPALSGAVGLQERVIDETFNATDSNLTINGQVAPRPLAYQAYFLYHPGLAVQLGLLLILVPWFIVFTPLPKLHPVVIGAVVSGIAVLPAILLGSYPWPVWLAQMVAWTGMYQLLTYYQLSFPSRLVGAHIAGLTTYYALHAAGGTGMMLLLAILPYVVYGCLKYRAFRWLGVVGICLIVAATYVLIDTVPTYVPSALPRDIFLDPYQVPHVQKGADQQVWHHYGSYVGLLGALLAVFGIVSTWRRFWLLSIITLSSLVLYGSHLMLPWMVIYLVVLVAYLIAFFASQGLHRLQTYLGESPVVGYLMILISFVILLDLLFVSTTTLEVPLL